MREPARKKRLTISAESWRRIQREYGAAFNQITPCSYDELMKDPMNRRLWLHMKKAVNGELRRIQESKH